MAEGLQPLQHSLDVDQGVEGVREQDHIEGFALPKRLRGKAAGVGHNEAQLRMALPGSDHHLRVQFDADPHGGTHPRQQVAEAAADLQHP